MQMDTSGWAWVDEHAERLGIRDMDKLIMKRKFRTLGQLLKMEAPELGAMLDKCEGMTYEDKGDFVTALAQWKSLLEWCRNVKGGTWKPRRPQTSEDLMALTEIDLSNCGITGEIPPGISYLTQLNVLDLGDNNLTGKIPKELGNCIQLKVLKLYSNKLEGNIPDALGNCTKLKTLFLNLNNLIGALESIAKLKKQLPNCSICV